MKTDNEKQVKQVEQVDYDALVKELEAAKLELKQLSETAPNKNNVETKNADKASAKKKEPPKEESSVSSSSFVPSAFLTLKI